MVESKWLSEKVIKVTWDAAAQAARMQSHVQLAHGEIIALESLL